MKTLTAAIFLISFTALTFSKAVIYVDFYANQKFIVENFCVNKAKPAMNCGGKCQLTKKINSEESKDRQNPNRKNESRNEITSPVTFNDSDRLFAFAYIAQNYPPFYAGKPVDQSPEIFRPPCV